MPPPPPPPPCLQLGGSLLASTVNATYAADLLAAANGDWSAVLGLLTGQAASAPGSAAAGGSSVGQAAGSQLATVLLNSGSQAGSA